MALPVPLRRALFGALSALFGLLPSGADAETTLRFLGSDNRPLAASRDALGISRHITHDESLPRGLDPALVSDDPANFRVEIVDAQARGAVTYARVEAISERGLRHGLLRHVPLRRVGDTQRFRSAFLRLVADETDLSAPDVGFQVLRAQLRDRVRVSLEHAPRHVSAEISVGHRGDGTRPDDILRGHLRLLVLRSGTGVAPVLGRSESDAVELARRQIEIANEIWAQCFIEFGEPEDAEVVIVDPPLPALLSVSDLDGLPAAGDGAVTVRAAGRSVGPVRLKPGALPEQTALELARAFSAAGFSAKVSLNPRSDHGAHPSADLIVRDAHGALVALSAAPEAPLSSDSRQRISIGAVDLTDGITEFDNTISAVGTLEERTLVKLLGDDDPATIDVLLINRFVHRDRQGEAFIEADGSGMANTLIFDRNAVRFERQAWVQAHELGHVLLDEALHPDNVGPDRPWLLMDSDARQGRVMGPKRLTTEECERARRRSGPGAFPVLLKPLAPSSPPSPRS